MMTGGTQIAGVSKQTASASILSGVGTLWGWALTSGATAGNLTIKDATTNTGAMVAGDLGTGSATKMTMLPVGIRFGTGIYASVDANVTAFTVYYTTD